MALAWSTAGFDGSNGPWAGLSSLVGVQLAMLALTQTRTALPLPGAVPAVLGCSWLATFACVPETSDQMFHIAAMLVVFGSTELLMRATLPWWLHSATLAAVAWAGLYGSAGRPSAIVGALFALWPLILPALTMAIVPRLADTPPWTRWVVVVLAAAASLATARSGALGPSLAPAIEDAMLFAVASAAVAIPFAAWWSRRTETVLRSTGSIAA